MSQSDTSTRIDVNIISIISCVMVICGVFFYSVVGGRRVLLFFGMIMLVLCTYGVSRMLLKTLLNREKRSWSNILSSVGLIILNISVLSWGLYSSASTSFDILLLVSLIVLNAGMLIIWGLCSYYVSTRLDTLFLVSLIVLNIGTIIIIWELYPYISTTLDIFNV